MWRWRLFYLGVLLAGGLFFVFFQGYLSFYVLLFLLALPVLSLAWLLASFRLTEVAVSSSKTAVEKKEPFSFQVRVRSSRALPVPCLRVTLAIANSLGGAEERERLLFPFFGGRQAMDQACRSAFCGRVTCAVVRARALDFLRLFSLPVRAGPEAGVFVLPSRRPAPAVVSEKMLLPGFGELTLPSQPGEDTSELFDTRPYREGDAINRIHWKLSAKEGELIVREGSCSAGHSLRFLLEYGSDLAENDCVMETFSRLAFLLAERGVPAEVCWLRGGELVAEPFSGEDDVSQLIGLLLARRPAAGVSALEQLRAAELRPCAHLVYVTPALSAEAVSHFAEEQRALRLTVLLCGAQEAAEQHGGAVIPVLPERVEACLAEVEL